MMRSILGCLALSTVVAACGTPAEELPFPITSVPASLETDPMTGMADRADDPAIWVNPENASESLILGTDKTEGLRVYGLDGRERALLEVGGLNNVDLRGDMAVATNVAGNGLSWFTIDPATSTVAHLGDTPVQQARPYGTCAGMVAGVFTAAVTYQQGNVEIWDVPVDSTGQVTPTLLRTVRVGSALEGCVFDDQRSMLFVGEEAVGIWKIDLSTPLSRPESVDTIAASNGLVEDIEGLSIWHDPDGSGYLVASAQAADRFVVYDLEAPHAPRGIFSVSANAVGSVDAVTHTDGLDITSASLPGFSDGVVIVQDDGNPEPQQDQNFKLVDWAAVKAALLLD